MGDESVVYQNPKVKGGFSDDAEKRERQLSGLKRGWEAARRRKDAAPKVRPSLESALSDDEKALLGKRRRALRKRFKPEQYPLLEMYLLYEILHQRAMLDCFSPDATSTDFTKLETASQLVMKAATQLQLTPKEERKGGTQQDGLAALLQRAAELNEKAKEAAKKEVT